MRNQVLLHTKTRTYFPVLTSFRFFAAFFIFLLHATNHKLIPEAISQSVDLSRAVTFFFVLSGFVLTHAYKDKNPRFLTFISARLSRIWPVTALSILFVLFVLPPDLFLPYSNSIHPSSYVLLSNIFCIQSLVPLPTFYFGYNAVCWTISVELFFYIVFYYLRSWNLLQITRLFFCNLFLILLINLFLHICTLPSFSLEHLDVPVWQGIIYINPFVRFPEFLAGVIASKLYFKYHSSSRPRSYHFNSRQSDSFILLFLSFIALLAAFYLRIPNNFEINEFVSLSIVQISSSIFFAIFILLVITSSGPLTSLLSARPLIILGNCSFSFYLFHQPLMIKAVHSGGFVFLGFHVLFDNFFSVLFCSLTVAMFSYYLFEVPVRRYLLYKFS